MTTVQTADAATPTPTGTRVWRVGDSEALERLRRAQKFGTLLAPPPTRGEREA